MEPALFDTENVTNQHQNSPGENDHNETDNGVQENFFGFANFALIAERSGIREPGKDNGAKGEYGCTGQECVDRASENTTQRHILPERVRKTGEGQARIQEQKEEDKGAGHTRVRELHPQGGWL